MFYPAIDSWEGFVTCSGGLLRGAALLQPGYPPLLIMLSYDCTYRHDHRHQHDPSIIIDEEHFNIDKSTDEENCGENKCGNTHVIEHVIKFYSRIHIVELRVFLHLLRQGNLHIY